MAGQGTDHSTAFIREYRRLEPEGPGDYDRRRAAGQPSWQAAARAAGVRTWRQLLEKMGLDGQKLTFSFDSPLLTRLRDLERRIGES